MRAVRLPSGRTFILSDTVGFVSSLPTGLVAAFRATLEEVLEADLIVHVRDIAHPDSEAQKSDVLGVLGELGLDEPRLAAMVEVRNKIDRLDPEARQVQVNRAAREPNTVALSAVSGEGCDALLELIDRRMNASRKVLDVSVALSDGATIAWLYRKGEVLSRRDDEQNAHLRVGLDAADAARFEHRGA
jgi:GTP-binding protein HflX